MTRPSVYITIAFVAMNLFAGIIGATGVADHIGVDHAVGGDETVDSVTEQAEASRSSAGVGDTLFALYHSTAVGLSGILNILPAFAMLGRVGVPAVWVAAFAQLGTLIVGIDILAFLKGYDL